MEQKNKKKPRAIFELYGSKFLHKLLDLEKYLYQTTDLTRPKVIFILVCCLLISGMFVSIFGPAPFTPIAWIICGLFTFSGLLMTIVFFLIVISAIYCIYRYNDRTKNEYDAERNITNAAKGIYGTAEFLVGDEIKEVYGLHPEKDLDSINGFVLGKVPNIELNMGYIGDTVTRDEKLMEKKHLSNRNVVIIGAPGTGKSASIMIPNLIESAKRGESVFVTDPKGELCDACSPIFRELGYDVKVFNLIYPWHSNGWNFMEWLSTLNKEDCVKWVRTISAMIIENTTGGKEDPYVWSSSAEKLLRALMSFLLEIAAPKAKVKDEQLDKFAENLKILRKKRDNSDTIEEQKRLNGQIEKVIQDKYKYMSDKVNQLYKAIETCNSPKEKARLIKMYRKLVAFRNDEALLPVLDKNNPPEDYEPLTVAEAKHRILNLNTCVRLLQFRIFVSKEEKAAFDAWKVIKPDEKMRRLLYELAFKVPYEQRSYKTLLQVFYLCDPNHSLAYSYWSSFSESSEAFLTSVKGGLDTRLSAFNQHDIKEMTSNNEIDLEKPGREKCAYFCIISDQETSLSYISSLFITIAFATLQSQADASPGRRLKVRTMFYLDEFPNIGSLYEYTKKLSTLRSRDIHIIMAVQNYPQMLQRYDENQCLEMFGDCDLMLFLGCGNETKTPEFVSRLMGEMTAVEKVRRRSGNVLIPFKELDYSETEQHSQRDLMYLSEIRGLEHNRLLALTRGQKPMQVEKYMYFDRPDIEWINMVKEKYPVISGHPLPGEEEINLDEVIAAATKHMDEMIAAAAKDAVPFEVLEKEARDKRKYEADTDADEVDLQMKTDVKTEVADFVAYINQIKAEGEYTEDEINAIMQEQLSALLKRNEGSAEDNSQVDETPITEPQDSLQDASDVDRESETTVKDYTSVFNQFSDGFTPVEKLIQAHDNEPSVPQDSPEPNENTDSRKEYTKHISKRLPHSVNPKDI